MNFLCRLSCLHEGFVCFFFLGFFRLHDGMSSRSQWPPTLCRRLWPLHERAGRLLAGTWKVWRASASTSARGGSVPSHSSAISSGSSKRDHAKACCTATANMLAQRWLVACCAAARRQRAPSRQPSGGEVRQLGAKTATHLKRQHDQLAATSRQNLWVSGLALTPPGVRRPLRPCQGHGRRQRVRTLPLRHG